MEYRLDFNLAKCLSMKKLSLRNVKFHKHFNSLSQLTYLEELNLTGVNLSSITRVDIALELLSCLRTLNLSNCDLDDDNFDFNFGKSRKTLEELRLDFNSLTKIGAIGNELPKLKKLSLKYASYRIF